MKYLRCPGCGRRTVYLHLGREDWWSCTYRYRDCTWSACAMGEDQVDVDGRRKLAEANPDADVWVTYAQDGPMF